jgi:DNA-binding response OmpR family regulator
MSTVLVVEDEAHLADGLRFNLEAEGHDVVVCDRGEAALERLRDTPVDVVVLDVMLPGMNGCAVVSALRQAHNFVPVLMLTALHRPEDVLKGFESGADDYLPKPFDLNIFLARIHSLLRRRQWVNLPTTTPPPTSNEAEVFVLKGRSVDFRALELRTPEDTIQLTQMEAELLRYLILNQNRAVSRQEILKQVWGLPADMDTRAIDNFIVRLRRYLEDDPGKPRHLLTVRGVGYKFVAMPLVKNGK